MSEKDNIKKMRRKAKLPYVFRYAAAALFFVTLLVVAIGYYRNSQNAEFRMLGLPTQLSKDVVASVSNYERREMDGDFLKYRISADKATTFSDDHQELENVDIEVFDENGNGSDRIIAAKAIYIPEENKNFTAFFAGDVNITTRDRLIVKTDQLSYKKETDTATAEELINFERDNIHGQSIGAVVKTADKQIELLKDVDITIKEAPDMNIRSGRLKAGSAFYDQIKEVIDLNGSVAIDLLTPAEGGDRQIDIASTRASAQLDNIGEGTRDIKTAELFGNVAIDTKGGDSLPANIRSGYAMYTRSGSIFDLKDNIDITLHDKQSPVKAKGGIGRFEQERGWLELKQNAEVKQASDLVRGDVLTAELDKKGNVRKTEVTGNGFLSKADAERTTEIKADRINGIFGDGQILQNAVAAGTVNATIIPAVASDYSRLAFTTPGEVTLNFKGQNMIRDMVAKGRTTIHLDEPIKGDRSSNKRLTADSVKTLFTNDGKYLLKAEAVGNAEFFDDPHKAISGNYRTTVNAPRFDCDFFETGNNPKTCTAETNTKTTRKAALANSSPDQVLTATKLSANFDQQSRSIESIDANGNAKFTEGDRNASANRFAYSTLNSLLTLRGGEPMVWDSSARARANEIDWNTRDNTSALRGSVSTTYYTQQQTGGAAPFSVQGKPVFLTANSAQFDHASESGVYSGNARAWQENNYVRGDVLKINVKQGTFEADGNVQSLLYDAKRKEGDKETNVPVHVAAKKMTYNNNGKVIRYENSVNMRQGADRLSGEVATIVLNESYDLSQATLENNVMITQPGRKAAGNFAQYTVTDEKVILRGDPATVDDSKTGSARGREVTVFMRENRVVGKGRTDENSSGRIRSVYKIN